MSHFTEHARLVTFRENWLHFGYSLVQKFTKISLMTTIDRGTLRRVPKQFLTSMELGEAARVVMRIAVDSDAPRPILFAAQLLVDACLAASVDGREASFRTAHQPATSA